MTPTSGIDAGSRSTRARGMALGVSTGGAAAALVATARSAGLLTGWPALVVLFLAILAIPTSREMSRRILLAGCLFFGWVPLLWWTPWPEATGGRAVVLMASIVGGLVGWVLHGPGVRSRAARLVPRIRAADALPFGAALGAAVMVRPWLTVPTADGALSMLVRGWDHSAHYDMVHMLRSHGAVVGALGAAPLGDTWSYRGYPQGFHAVAATLMEAQAGVRPGAARAEVLLYAHTLGVLAVLGALVVAAGLCALPQVRRRPLVASPVVALASGALLVGPGAFALSDGFPNFALAVVLLICIPLVVMPLDRVVLPVHLAAIGGAVVGVAHGWALLLAMALPAVAVLVVPIRGRRFAAGRPAWWSSAVIALLTAVGVVVAVQMVARQPLTEILTVAGGITAPPMHFLVVPGVVAVLAGLAAVWRLRRGGVRRGDHVRVVAMAALPLVGLIGAAGIAVLQLRSGDSLGYYFWKFAIAVAGLSNVLAAVVVVSLLPPRLGLSTRSARSWVVSGALTLAATQVYGLTLPVVGARWVSPALSVRAALSEAAVAPVPVAGYLWGAADAGLAPDRRHVLLIAGVETGVHSVTAGQWYNAVTGRWTDQANEELTLLLKPLATPAERADVVVEILSSDLATVVVVPPEQHAELAERVPDSLRARLITW